ncbi:MAG TPA: 50S ribosomal protein L30 [Bacteroidia bacterium]|nr:50S ribosomal protein L30 [Bacteroidia bacterium]HNT80248.1 50S ribosomal protein L30 [Bacteroidia bacterium]
MKKITIKQIKSGIDRPAKQKRTLKALGLNRMNHQKEVEASPQVMGMINAVKHLVEIVEK